jgi:hypothetical protein
MTVADGATNPSRILRKRAVDDRRCSSRIPEGAPAIARVIARKEAAFYRNGSTIVDRATKRGRAIRETAAANLKFATADDVYEIAETPESAHPLGYCHSQIDKFGVTVLLNEKGPDIARDSNKVTPAFYAQLGAN